jgi:protein phosphatase
MTIPELYITAAGMTDRGRVRKANEDSFAAVDLNGNEKFAASFEWNRRRVGENGIMLAVADGMGGARGGEIASRMAVELLGETLAVDNNRQTDKGSLKEIIELVNQDVRLFADKNPSLSGMGSTLTAVLINDGRALIGQVGDSRCYLLRNRRLTRLTKDQSFVQALVDAGQMTAKEAEASPQKNIILSAIGQENEVVPVIGEIEIERGDILLLCSDGLSNMVGGDEMRDVLCRNLSPAESCRLLVELANQRGGTDNITVIVAQIFDESISRAEEITIKPQTLRELF